LEEDLKANHQNPFSEKDYIHIGEEIADVFIYTTRLCDVSNINLGNAVLQLLELGGHNCSMARPWPILSFTVIEGALLAKTNQFRSQRHISLELQVAVGDLCRIFAQYPESQSQPELFEWTSENRKKLTNQAATICMLMICLAKFCHLSIGQCITDKFLKNDAKYPVELSKGSSAKYTAYTGLTQEQIHLKLKSGGEDKEIQTKKPKNFTAKNNMNNSDGKATLLFVGIAILGFLVGRYSSSRIR
jgi:dCTP diphosphatase